MLVINQKIITRNKKINKKIFFNIFQHNFLHYQSLNYYTVEYVKIFETLRWNMNKKKKLEYIKELIRNSILSIVLVD